MLRVEGVPQFSKEVTELKQRPDLKLCHMMKLHENGDTEEFEDRNSIQEVIIAEHISPRQLI